MSRRIVASITAIGVIAVGSFFLVSPTFADRECFGGLCRMPDVAEPPEPQAAATPEITETPLTPDPAGPPAAAPAMASQPIATPALRPAAPATIALPRPVLPKPASAPAIAAKRPTPAAAPAPRFVEEDVELSRPVRRPVRQAEPLPAPERPQPVQITREVPPAYGVQQAPVHATRHSSSVVVVSAPTIYGDNGVLVVHPDSSWKLCQGDQADGRRYQYCGPNSYHPYGSNGYRPLGTYREYRAAPAYVYAPSAKIISIENAD